MRLRAGLLLITLISASLGLGLTVAPPAASFGQPSATTTFGEPIVFSTDFSASQPPKRVDVLVSLPGADAVTVLPATISGGPTEFQATATLEGYVAPNTRYVYQFRARHDGGSDAYGPQAEVTVVDERFDWRTVEGPTVRLHWYDGDDAFARRALDIGEQAIANATQLLGVTDFAPVDFFIYADRSSFYDALGPGTRENVGGQANQATRTMLGLIQPGQVDDSWVDTLVAHELTHLVFNSATENPYHRPPRWLNEGVAVYLSDGYSSYWQSFVDDGVDSRRLIPLDGLAGLFPTTANEFNMAYGELVAAVSYFVDTYGEEELWQLVRSYADGVSDDHAFVAATGSDVAAFNEAWMGSLGLDVPQPYGPQPAPPGAVPPGWDVEPAPTADPNAPTPAAPRPTPRSGGTGDPAAGLSTLITSGILVGAVLIMLVGWWLMRRRRSAATEDDSWLPPQGPWSDGPPTGP